MVSPIGHRKRYILEIVRITSRDSTKVDRIRIGIMFRDSVRGLSLLVMADVDSIDQSDGGPVWQGSASTHCTGWPVMSGSSVSHGSGRID